MFAFAKELRQRHHPPQTAPWRPNHHLRGGAQWARQMPMEPKKSYPKWGSLMFPGYHSILLQNIQRLNNTSPILFPELFLERCITAHVWIHTCSMFLNPNFELLAPHLWCLLSQHPEPETSIKSIISCSVRLLDEDVRTKIIEQKYIWPVDEWLPAQAWFAISAWCWVRMPSPQGTH